MDNNNNFIENSDIIWQETGDGIQRKIMAYDENLMVARVHFKKGSIGAMHSHFHSQISNIEYGVFEVTIDQQKKILKSGDAFYVPPNVPHGCTCLEEGVVIDSFYPMRKDFFEQAESKEELKD